MCNNLLLWCTFLVSSFYIFIPLSYSFSCPGFMLLSQFYDFPYIFTPVKHNKDYTIRPKFVIHPTSKYIKIHGNVSLECVATSSVENLIIINWYLDGQPVHNRKTVESKLQYVRANLYKKSSSLLLSDIRHDERGRYWCDAVNIYGSRRSKEANVTIVGK